VLWGSTPHIVGLLIVAFLLMVRLQYFLYQKEVDMQSQRIDKSLSVVISLLSVILHIGGNIFSAEVSG
jgi:hypothetical protein